jgi:hypothetical protein
MEAPRRGRNQRVGAEADRQRIAGGIADETETLAGSGSARPIL